MSIRKCVFLDRDGTIIVDKVYLNDPGQVELLPGVVDGMQRLRKAGFEFVVVTNQSGIPRGLVTLENLNLIHKRIREELSRQGIEFLGFYFAPYMTNSDHPLRKPNPGMLLQAAKDFNISLKDSWTIGDRMLDVEAGHRAGTRAVLLEGRESVSGSDFSAPEYIAKDFLVAADLILRGDV